MELKSDPTTTTQDKKTDRSRVYFIQDTGSVQCIWYWPSNL